ncbi:MAG: DUF4230 domain-containing protein [Staphylococcus sp.]|nr:DUF4230 domain-containing protein [Staphylococcus sp.]
MIKRYITLIITIVIIAGVAAIILWRSTAASTNMSVSETKLSEIKEMVKLCSLEVRDDVAIKDSINGKWIFAKNTVNGYIRFDLEKLDYQTRNDSVIIFLPPEEIEIYESNSDGAYEVIDTWNESLLDLRTLTAAEESAIKRRMAERYRKSFYTKGYVSRARRSAVETLSQLVSVMDDKITIVDLHPQGFNAPE